MSVAVLEKYHRFRESCRYRLLTTLAVVSAFRALLDILRHTLPFLPRAFHFDLGLGFLFVRHCQSPFKDKVSFCHRPPGRVGRPV